MLGPSRRRAAAAPPRCEDEDAARAARELVVFRSDQPVFHSVVESYLRRLDFADDGYARLIRLPAYEVAEVLVDPNRGFGQPIFARGGARLEDAVRIATRIAA